MPGLIITQHDGGGKANQYYLRGFNLDHGTDLATSLDGVPLNLPSHAHGQGYTDTNWLIPELVRTVNFQKGPFSSEQGDFSNAASVEIRYQKELPRNLATLESGTLGYARGLVAASQPLAGGTGLYAFEASHYDGAWTAPDDYQKANAVLRFSKGKDSGQAGAGYSISAQGYYGQWIGSEQVPERAIDSGLIGRYGTLDRSDGGLTHRLSTYGEWHRQDDNSATEMTAYLVHYGLNLYSDFTYFIDQTNGDQIEQKEARTIGGLNLKHTLYGQFGTLPTDHTFGIQARRDDIRSDLAHTAQRRYLNGVRADTVAQQNFALWYANRTQWWKSFRTVLGGRVDTFTFADASDDDANSGSKSATAFSPKLNFIYSPLAKTEAYLSLATGLRSADARGILLTQEKSGGPTRNLPPITRSRAAEIGVRNSSLAGLNTSVGIWLLDTDSDTVFSADSGSVEDSGRAGRRVGLEWNNFYEGNGWLTVDADLALSRARFTQASAADPGDHIPDSVSSAVAAGVTVHDGPLCAGCFAGLRLRYFGARDLDSQGSERSQPSLVLNFAGGYAITKNWQIKAEVLNLTNSKYNDAEYFAQSRLRGEAAGPDQGGTDDHLVHPGEPLSVRLGLVAYF